MALELRGWIQTDDGGIKGGWHSPTSETGTRVAANYVAAWEALKKMRPTNYTLGRMLRLALCSLMLAACGAVAQGPLPIDQGPESFDRSPQDDNGL